MSVNSRQYVRKEGVSAGWDKCQGALSRRSAALHGVYQDAACEGSCYVRVDKNQSEYRLHECWHLSKYQMLLKWI